MRHHYHHRQSYFTCHFSSYLPADSDSCCCILVCVCVCLSSIMVRYLELLFRDGMQKRKKERKKERRRILPSDDQ